MKKSIFLILLAFSFSFVFSESFRVNQVSQINLPADASGEVKFTVNAGVSDAVAVHLPKDRTFFKGVEFSIKVPKTLAEWGDAVAWSFYDQLTGDLSQKDFEGRRVCVGTFLSGLSLNIVVPFEELPRKNAYSVYVEDDVLNDEDFIFFRLQLAMKGTDEAIQNSRFEICVKPVFGTKGKLKLNLTTFDSSDVLGYTSFIDEQQMSFNENLEVLLEAGTHTLNLVSDFYRNEVRTFTIEKAAVTVLDVLFKDIAPNVRFAAPDGTQIFFDDERILNPQELWTTVPGNHVVKFRVGDYETARSIEVEAGKTYTVTVSIDAVISEE